MKLFSTPWDVFVAAGIAIAGALLCINIGRSFAVSRKRALLLYLWHTLFCVIYANYVLVKGGDAITYYQSSLTGDTAFGLGTQFVWAFTGLFSSVLSFSLFSTFVIYNLIGSIGLLAFDASLHTAVSGYSRRPRIIAELIVFLPSISFWSSAIGKDAISFMATGLALWAALDLRRRTWLLLLAIALMFLVRPHIGALLVGTLAVSMFIQTRMSRSRRMLIGVLALGAAVLLVPIAVKYVGLGTVSNVDVGEVQEYIGQRQAYNDTGGGGIDISSMNLPEQLFAYMFRPLPYEAKSLVQLAASIDNLIILLLFSVGLYRLIPRGISQQANHAFLWMYSLSAWLILAMTTANLGIAVRQKWMFAPMLIFLLISAIGKPRHNLANELVSLPPSTGVVPPEKS